MAKFHGNIGFSITEETVPGVWEDKVVEFPYKGEFITDYRRWDSGQKINDDLSLNNSISIIADDFLNENMQAMKYVCYMGSRWKISSIELARPRLKLSFGGVYDGPIPESDTEEETGAS